MEKPYGRSVDWWAFGVLIYEMHLGQAPFRGHTEDDIFDSILHDPIHFPRSNNLSRDGEKIIIHLLNKDPARRLGSGPGDAADVKAHPYFRGVNWEDIMQKRIPPPFVPKIKHQKDVSNFDKEFTRELPVLTPMQSTLLEADQEEFRDFSYVAGF